MTTLIPCLLLALAIAGICVFAWVTRKKDVGNTVDTKGASKENTSAQIFADMITVMAEADNIRRTIKAPLIPADIELDSAHNHMTVAGMVRSSEKADDLMREAIAKARRAIESMREYQPVQ